MTGTTDGAALAEQMARLGNPVPGPPSGGALLVPEGYVGWILITTPGGRRRPRRKVRYLGTDGHVYRDDLCVRGGRFHVKVHAFACRVEPVAITTGLPQWQLDNLAALLAGAGATARDEVVVGLLRPEPDPRPLRSTAVL